MSFPISNNPPNQQNNTKTDRSFPTKAWGYVISRLSAPLKKTCACLNRQFAIHVMHNPCNDFEQMNLRAAKNIHPSNKKHSSKGPSENYLLSNPASESELYSVLTIRAKMQQDPSIARTVREIFQMEMAMEGYSPSYHCMNSQVYCYTLFTKELLGTIYDNSNEVPSQNPLVRFPNSAGTKTMKEFLNLFPVQDKYDHIDAVRKEVLCLNPYFFANLMADGESTWFMYVENKSVSPPTPKQFFVMLCKQFGILLNEDEKEKHSAKFEELAGELDRMAYTYIRQISSSNPDVRDNMSQRGVVLQMLIPDDLIDDICYASEAYGIPEKNPKKLSERLKMLRHKPRSEKTMQIRMLAQSILVPNHHIVVNSFGYGDFFEITPETCRRPSGMPDQDWMRALKAVERKSEILAEARKLFQDLFLTCRTANVSDSEAQRN